MAQKSPRWKSDVETSSETESLSTTSFRDDNVFNVAWQISGLYGSRNKIALFLEDWDLAKVALSCHIALDM